MRIDASSQTSDDKEKKDATQALLDSFRAKSLGGKSDRHPAGQRCVPRIRSVDISGLRTYQREPVSSGRDSASSATKREVCDEEPDSCMVVVLERCLVPFAAAEEKSALPLPDPGNVTLTLDEYNKLVELAAKPPKKIDTGAASLLHQACRPEAARWRTTACVARCELEGEVFHKGVSKVPLTSGMTILDAHQNGKGVPLIQENGTHVALLPGPGEFSVALEPACRCGSKPDALRSRCRRRRRAACK